MLTDKAEKNFFTLQILAVTVIPSPRPFLQRE